MTSVACDRPPDFSHYEPWLKQRHGVVVDTQLRGRYESVTAIAAAKFAETALWTGLREQLREANAQYQVDTRFLLLNVDQPLVLHRKPFQSYLLKTFRKNCLSPSWPYKPEPNWFLPDRCIPEINDLIRTRLIVRYLDGVEYLLNRIQASAESNGLAFRSDMEAKEDGYYAAHAYLSFTCDVPTEAWVVAPTTISIELQITTQIQEVISNLTHQVYEQRRAELAPRDKWQWNYRSPQFKTNYLSHILHYMEGMIMDVRDTAQETPDA